MPFSCSEIIKKMITLIAARKSWDLNDYPIEALPQPQDSSPTAKAAAAEAERERKSRKPIAENGNELELEIFADPSQSRHMFGHLSARLNRNLRRNIFPVPLSHLI